MIPETSTTAVSDHDHVTAPQRLDTTVGKAQGPPLLAAPVAFIHPVNMFAKPWSEERFLPRLPRPVVLGFLLRMLVATLLPALLDHTHVPYTDLDYTVYQQAADYVQEGGNPYDRITYRYTPFLAALLALLPWKEVTARLLFCTADTLCGWIIGMLRRKKRKKRKIQPMEGIGMDQVLDVIWWLYNPLAIYTCTRGSAESLLVLLPVLVTIAIVIHAQQKTHDLMRWSILAGIVHGVAIHAKLYPVIYTLALTRAFVRDENKISSRRKKDNKSFFKLIARILTQPAPVCFGVVSALVFAGLTALSAHWYGQASLTEGLLYHFSRVDHRHNYAPHWYGIYLARFASSSTMAAVGRLLLLPQVLLLVVTSLYLDPLPLALFVQTFLFVAQNKVITAQYFTWYLCLLPLCGNCLRLSSPVNNAVQHLIASVGGWLTAAYLLEMRGWAVHRLVWVASLCFFVAHIRFLRVLLTESEQAHSKKRN